MATRTRVKVASRKKAVPVVKTSGHSTEIAALVDDVAKNMKSIERLQKKIQAAMPTIESLMLADSVRLAVTMKGNKGEISTPKTRAANKIDAEKFYEATDDDEFFATINVPIAGAKKVLSEKDLDRITIKGRTAQKDDVCKVTPA